MNSTTSAATTMISNGGATAMNPTSHAPTAVVSPPNALLQNPSNGGLSQEGVMPAMASASHRYAQQLNNSAALCIEIGLYSRAISSLQRALELNRTRNKEWKDQGHPVCMCYSCTLNACIAYSESTDSEATTVTGESYAESTASNNKRRKVFLSSKRKSSSFWKPPVQMNQLQHDFDSTSNKENYPQISTRTKKSLPQSSSVKEDRVWKETKTSNDSDDSCTGGYIYRRPIRVRCEGHAMGSTLYLIITFNLALAYHLQTICHFTDQTAPLQMNQRSKSVSRTLALYELTYKWHLKLLCADRSKKSADGSTSKIASCTAVSSIRFNMMIRNNLSQIHRLVGNHEKHKRCLEHLLSTVMVVAEYKSRSVMNRVMSNNRKDPRVMELDGFVQNTTSLVLQNGHCANAA